MTLQKTILLVGLGNPGAEYASTRHNVGFMAIDNIAAYYNANRFSVKFKSQYSIVYLDNYKIILQKPLTYMNNSGVAVAQTLSFFKLSLDHLIVIHDDIDLQNLQIKYKTGGGAGGHNGLKSIDQHCGNNYHRLRIGMGRPSDKNFVSNYVLSNFTKIEILDLTNMLDLIAANLALLIKGHSASFFDKIQQKVR